MKNERRINLELRKKIDKLIAEKEDVTALLEKVRVIERWRKAELEAYEEALDNLVRGVFREKGGKNADDSNS